MVYVFGSHASGEVTPTSDVDLAVLASRPLDPVARWKLQEVLAADLHRAVDLVDLVDLRRASTVMRARIVDTGSVLWEAYPGARSRFEVTALAAYARLNEETAWDSRGHSPEGHRAWMTSSSTRPPSSSDASSGSARSTRATMPT